LRAASRSGHFRQDGGRVIDKIAHCVGDVDKRTISENLGGSVDGHPGQDREYAAAGGGWWWKPYDPIGGSAPSNRHLAHN